MNKVIFLLIGTLFVLRSTAQNEPILTQRITVRSDFELKITKPNVVVLEPFKIYTVSGLGLSYANYNEEKKTSFYTSTECGNMTRGYNDPRLKTYDIEISDVDGSKKKYYGKLALFVSKRATENLRQTDVYEIKLEKKNFDYAANGHTERIDEHYNLDGHDYPTWVIWLSDVPFMNEPATNLFRTTSSPPQTHAGRMLASGITQTALAYGAFLPCAAIFGKKGLEALPYKDGDTKTIIYLSGAGVATVAGVVMAITGPIRIAHAARLIRKNKRGGVDLCLYPGVTPDNHLCMGASFTF